MKLIVGLGNPGKEYEKNRHNVGFKVVDKLGEVLGKGKFVLEKRWEAEVMKIDDLILVKPTTFMNASGRTVRKIKDYFKVGLDEIWVVHDDLDIVLGEYKMQKGKGPKVHNGLKSVEESLGKKDFWRVRVGVDGRGGKSRELAEKYVLKDFGKQEGEVVKKVVGRVVDEFLFVLA